MRHSFGIEKTTEQEIEFDLECDTCLSPLECTIGHRARHQMDQPPTISVTPCKKCIDDAEETGRSEA